MPLPRIDLSRSMAGKARWVYAGFLVLLLLVPHVVTSGYLVRVMTQVGIYIILALGMNVIVGYAGLLNIGYVAFYAVGAYTYAFLASDHFGLHLPTLVVVPCAVVLAAAFGAVVAALTVRLRGDYLAVVTMSFAEVLRILINNMDFLTNGPKGITSIDNMHLGRFEVSSNAQYYYLVLALCLLAVVFSLRLERSRVGFMLLAVREDEDAAEAVGVDTKGMKILASAAGAAMAGLAGTVFAAFQGFISPESFVFWETVTIVCMVVLGGMASVPGVVLGAVLLVFLPEWLREFADYRMLLYGLAFILMMHFRPEGIWPSSQVRRKLRQ
ncbi:MAG: branched-chain amino acid ABC transporter permease [Bacillota bacterium]|nr:branched-chain amino acid ABC transporter permease [Bacillota bacterium]